MLHYPDIDPVAFSLGPLVIRWYALAYMAGLLSGWFLMRRMARSSAAITAEMVDDFLTWTTVGVIFGGRLGYVLFYKPAHYLANPADIVRVWEGGMSFHGGCIGVILAVLLFARRHRVSPLELGDMVCTVVPLGLFFGRIANFINGELYGRVTEGVAWAMVFPHGGPLPRHPSQLYEAGLEGALLFAIAWPLSRLPWIRQRPGTMVGVFLAGYGLARFTCEFYREPDAFLGYLWGGATMGQLLSLPMIALGGLLVLAAHRWAGRHSRQPAA